MKNKKVVFAGSFAFLIGLFVLAVGVYNYYKNEGLSQLAKEQATVFVRDYSPVYGNKDAKVTVVEFLDPECESCRMFYPQVKNLLKEFEGKVKLVVRYAAFHGNSKEVIKALESARKQGKYWESLEKLFHYQPMWGSHHNPQVHLIYGYLAQLGIDMDELKENMKDPKIESIITQDSLDLKTLNVRGTPTFFVNGKALEQFGMKYLKSSIEAEIKNNY